MVEQGDTYDETLSDIKSQFSFMLRHYGTFMGHLWDITRYMVGLKKTKEGFAVWCPGLPGCWSQGKTGIKALENIKDAIKEYLVTAEKLTQKKEIRYVEVVR